MQDLVLPRAGALSTSELREITGLAVITVDPDAATDRHHRAAARRELTMTALPDAMASLTAFLPAAAATAGQLTYRPRQDLRDHATALLNICQFPSCRQPAWRCDLDHREPFNHTNPDRGGPTTPDNTNPTCRRHHLLKHHTAPSAPDASATGSNEDDDTPPF